MGWQEAAQAFQTIETKDLESFSLSEEDSGEILTLFNRSVKNAQNDGGDMALIAMKKILTRYPNWGEAALLYGICLALEGQLNRAKASISHALQIGFLTVDYRELAEYCYGQVEEDIQEIEREAMEQKEEGKGFFTSRGKKNSIYHQDPDTPVIPMQTPILTKVPKNAGKARFANEQERRDIRTQANMTAEGEVLDEEIDVAIPKTPAEKIRTAVLILTGVLLAGVIGCIIWFVAVPAFRNLQSSNQAEERLDYLMVLLRKNREDPEIQSILESYDDQFSGT